MRRALKSLLVAAFFCALTVSASAQSDDIRGAQKRLLELGYNPGVADGVIGARTRDALKAFQTQQLLPITGQLDQATVLALGLRIPTPASPPKARLVTASQESSTWPWWVAIGVALLWILGRKRGKTSSKRSTERRHEPQPKINVEVRSSFEPDYFPDLPANSEPLDGNKFWVPANRTAQVAGFTINGLVYVGKGLIAHYRPENCLIDPGLPVAKNGPDRAGAQMPYWPSYSAISPSSRLAYLQWLSTGKKATDFGVGYVFLYFYGLERRLLIDNCTSAEQKIIVDEIARLRAIYASNRSFDRYSQQLLDTMTLLAPDFVPIEPVFTSVSYELPLVVRIGVGRLIAEEKPIDAAWLLSWWITHPETRLRTPTRRAFDEFRKLFEIRFNAKYPEGLRISAPKRSLAHTYRASSGTFERTFSDEISWCPDISRLTKPLTIATEIADACAADLDAFSRYLGRNPEGRNTLEAFALLPAELARITENAQLGELRDWIDQTIKESDGLASVEALLERLHGERPTRVTRRLLNNACEALSHLSIGLAPDPDFAFRLPVLSEPVKLFRLSPDDVVTSPSQSYPGALLSLTFCAFVAHADDSFVTSERQHLVDQISQFAGLSSAEKTRLIANIDWMIAVPPRLSQLRSRLRECPEQQKKELGQLAIAVASSDGVIAPGEVKAIQKLFAAMGLPDDGIYAELHEMTANSAMGPVSVSGPTSPVAQFKIPQPPTEKPTSSAGVLLDNSKVSAIMEDTARASSVLSAIFVDETVTEPTEVPDDNDAAPSVLATLDGGHRAFAEELLSKSEWSRDGFNILAKQFGLLPDGACEAINEWAYSNFEEPLIEEDDDFVINSEISKTLARELKGGSSVAD